MRDKGTDFYSPKKADDKDILKKKEELTIIYVWQEAWDEVNDCCKEYEMNKKTISPLIPG